MRILFILQRPPFPPTDGERWKICNLLEFIALRHRCDIVSFGNPADRDALREAARRLPGLRVLGIFSPVAGPTLRLRQLLALATGFTFPSSLRYQNAELAKTVLQLIRDNDYDLVHVDLVNLLWLRPYLQQVPSLISITDPASLRYERRVSESGSLLSGIVARVVGASLRKHEARWLPRYDLVHVVSSEDADYLYEVHGLHNVSVVGISVDPVYLRLPVPATLDGDAFRLFSSGPLDEHHVRRPLESFLAQEWPRISAAHPGWQWTYIGCARRPYRIIRSLQSQTGVHYHPWVDDYTSTLAQSDVAVFFDRGGTGIKNRIMQAMAAARPTIGFRECFSGMHVENGKHCLIAADQPSLVRHLETLRENPHYARILGENARSLVASQYSTEAIGQRWEMLYSRLARNPSQVIMEGV